METVLGAENLDIGVETAKHPSPRSGTGNVEGGHGRCPDERDRPHLHLDAKEVEKGTIDMRTPWWLHRDRCRMYEN